MIRTLLIVSLISLTIGISCNAQPIEFLSTKEIANNKRILLYKDAEVLFQKVPEALPLYQESRKQLKRASVAGGLALGSLVFGITLGAIDQHEGHCDLICLTQGQVIGLSAVLFAFPTFGITYLIMHSVGKKKMMKTINTYNSAFTKNSPELSIGFTQGGLGFVLKF